MDEPVTMLVASLEIALWCAGVVLLCRLAFVPRLRTNAKTSRLPAWNISVADFFLFLFYLMAGTVVAGLVSTRVASYFDLRGDAVTVTHGAGAQLGMMLGFFAFRARRARPTAAPAPAPANQTDPVPAEFPPILPAAPAGESVLGSNIFVAGAATFLMAMPILLICVHAWETVLTLFRLPVDRQDLIGMFANADSPWMVALMVTLAVVIAPITEELVFRAGLYRYLRTRIPRWLALTAPALFFAALHVDWQTYRGLASLVPLLALAVIFSLAYEHTGRIGTVIVAHALFNLNTVLMIFGGVT